MNYVKEYLKIISYILVGAVFSFSVFYLYINIFHSLELSKKYNVNVSESTTVKSYYDRINTIENNIKSFNTATYSGTVATTKMQSIRQNLTNCVNSLKGTYLEEIRNSNSVGITDVYKLRDSYENDILSECIINNLYWTLDVAGNNINSTYLLNNQDLLVLHVNMLKGSTAYLKKDLLNNSSYFFNTSTASSGVKDNVRDGFYETLGAYKDASMYVEYLSNWFKKEAGGM